MSIQKFYILQRQQYFNMYNMTDNNNICPVGYAEVKEERKGGDVSFTTYQTSIFHKLPSDDPSPMTMIN